MQASKFLNRDRGFTAPLQYSRQKAFHIGADPVEQVNLADTANIRGAQGIVVRRSARRQEDFRVAHTVLHGSGDQLQGLDAGQQTNLGLSRADCQQTGEKSDKKGKKSGHDGHSR
ncbi:hypothetical protein D3C76_1345430 [compost metagenome]